MKNLKFSLVLLIFCGIFASCSSDDDSSSNDNNNNNNNNNNQGDSEATETANEVSTFLLEEEWTVTFYEEDGTTQTDLFAGYSFTFDSEGSVTGGNELNSQSGTWSTSVNSNTPKFLINFNDDAPFDELNEDWDIINHNATLLELENTNDSDGLDRLTFTRQ